MADNRTPEERKRNMSSVRNRGSKPELKLLEAVKRLRLSGWRRNYRRAFGAPDLAFPKRKIAIFVDGCFWHGCECKTIPETNREFWQAKIASNVRRDTLVLKRLAANGWVAIRIKEHELREPAKIELLLKKYLN